MSASLGAELIDYGSPSDLLDELVAWATQPRFCCAHDWAIGVAVLRDNTAVLHRALPYDPSSDRMRRRAHIAGQEA